MAQRHDQPVDYMTWTTTDLINRIVTLESQVQTQQFPNTTKHPSPQTLPPSKKPRKAAKPKKPFNRDKYTTRLIALKFAYLGEKYNGFEHHANNTTRLPTVEEELWRALMKTKLIFPEPSLGRSEDEVCWDGCEYSKCGRTDRGVSAFGQVIGVRVRSSRPKTSSEDEEEDSAMVDGADEGLGGEDGKKRQEQVDWDPVRDELPYIQLINRVLPPDIRILAWCAHTPADFSARFNCRERRYRYFFTNPAYMPLGESQTPSCESATQSEGWLNIGAMDIAAKKYEGLHDFRNLCKVDPSKQLTSFERRIFHAGIHEVQPSPAMTPTGAQIQTPRLYYFEVRGSAFLWHQVRHLVAILFLVGQGYEKPSVVDELLDIQRTLSKPMYEMASDAPLVLWDCIFPDPEEIASADHADRGIDSTEGYKDGLQWIYIGDELENRDQAKRSSNTIVDGKYGRNGIMDDLWAIWRKRRVDEVLAWSLMEVVAGQGQPARTKGSHVSIGEDRSDRVFDGSERPRTVGEYVPIMQRDRMETPEVVNARYAVRKGLNSASSTTGHGETGISTKAVLES